MPAVCLLAWALDNLPETPEFARKPTAVFRVVAWLFPNPQHYDPKAHFQEGTIMTTYDFRSASRSLAIAANQNFSKPRWVGEPLEDKGHYLLLEDLLPGISMEELFVRAVSSGLDRKGHIEGTMYDYEVPGMADFNGVMASPEDSVATTKEILLTHTDNGQAIRGFPTP
eukprot:RCo053573